MRIWEKVDVENARVPAEAVEAFVNKLEAEGCLMHGFAMADNGKLVAEGYWAPFHKDSLHRMYSVGKSFTSLAIGLLRAEGKLSLDDNIYTYFPDKCPEDEVHSWMKLLTIRDMLTMRTCHAKTTYKLYDGDWVESFFRVKPTNLPGAVFAYDTSSTHVLSALVERLSGRKLLDYLREKCFDKIGVSKEAYFMCDPSGVSMGGSGLNCKLRDLLSVAQLVLDGGEYEGEQLLPKDYLAEATAFKVSTLQQPAYDEQLGYGYQIWQGRYGSFQFYGIGGQLAVCLPKEKFVLVTMGNTLDNKNGIKNILDAFFETIYPWICEPEKRKPALLPQACAADVEKAGLAADRLQERLANLSLPKIPGGSSFWGESGVTLNCFESGREYHFGKNALDIHSMQVELSEGCGMLKLEKEDKDFVLQFGNESYIGQKFPWNGSECCCMGAKVEENTLFLRCHIFGPDMANLTIAIHFAKQGATIKMQKGADDAMKNFEGVASGN